MTTTLQLVTANELFAMPDDSFRYELVKGELRKTTPAGHHHGSIAIKITIPLGQYVENNHLGTVYAAETGFILSQNPDTVRAPDVAFVKADRVKEIQNKTGYFPGAPDLAVEVLSPNDSYTEVEEKVMCWLDAGCQMVVVVNPQNRSVTVYRSRNEVTVLTESETLDGGDVVPGWQLPICQIFE